MDTKQIGTLGSFLVVLLMIGLPAGAQDTSVEIISVDEQPFQQAEETGPVPVNRVLAVVGKQVLTMSQYRNRYGDTKLSYRRLKPMVDTLLLEEATRTKEVSLASSRLDRLVERQIERVSRAPGGLRRLLSKQGLTKQQYRAMLRRRIKRQGLKTRLVPLYFPELGDSDTRPASVSVRARLILVDDVATAWQIYDWLNDQPGEATWNQLFERYSRRMSLMDDHGDLGWFNWGHFNREVEYRIFKLPLYAVSKPFRLRNGYALVYPTGYRFTPDRSVDDGSLQAYRGYEQRYYREKLIDRLREDFSVNYPSSVRGRLNLP